MKIGKFDSLFKQWAEISKLVVDGKLAPELVSQHLQEILDGKVGAPSAQEAPQEKEIEAEYELIDILCAECGKPAQVSVCKERFKATSLWAHREKNFLCEVCSELSRSQSKHGVGTDVRRSDLEYHGSPPHYG